LQQQRVMSGRRKSSVALGTSAGIGMRASKMNFNVKNETLRGESRGTKPTANPTSIKEVLIVMVMHLCKKTIFFDVRLKVALYLLALFFVSLIGGELWKILRVEMYWQMDCS
jgi:hypothetical protein